MRLLTTIIAAAAAVHAVALPEADPWCRQLGNEYCQEYKREALPTPAPVLDPKAEAEAEADPWCRKPGQPCWRQKRAAEAEPWCRKPGQPCWRVKRAADVFAESVAAFDGTIDRRSPEALLSHSEGGAAFKAKRALDELANVVAAAQDDPFEYYDGLSMEKRFVEDTTALARREAMPDAEADPWCRKPGQPCWKVKRDGLTEADGEVDLHAEDKHWCNKPGWPCYEVKRAAEALAQSVGEPAEDLETREFNPVSKREPAPWCRKPGQACWKRDADPEPWCRKPGQPCWKATRDLHAMQNVAHSVIASLL